MEPGSNSTRGHTLIELVVVMTIVTIILLPAMAGIRHLLAGNLVASSANDLRTILGRAREEAIIRNRHLVLCPSLDGRNCRDEPDRWHEGYILFVDENENREHDSHEPLLFQSGRLRGVRIATSSGRKRLAYHPSGWASGYNATVTICGDAPVARKLVISNTGRVKIREIENPCR